MNFWRKFDRRGPYKNSEILYYLKLLLENIFWLNYMFPSSKEVFLHNFRQFLKKMNFCRKYDRPEPYKNSEIFYSLKFVLRIYFLAKLFVPLIKRSVSRQFEAIFGKLIFWRKFDRRGRLWLKAVTEPNSAIRTTIAELARTESTVIDENVRCFRYRDLVPLPVRYLYGRRIYIESARDRIIHSIIYY